MWKKFSKSSKKKVFFSNFSGEDLAVIGENLVNKISDFVIKISYFGIKTHS